MLTALALVAVAATGCTVLQTAAFLIRGTDTAAEYDGLTDKRVAVICKSEQMEELSNNGMARALSEALFQQLKDNDKKIRLVEPQKIAALMDEQGLEDPIQIGRKLKAEKVLVIDIESFRVNEGQTLYQGRAALKIHVYDVASKEEEWHKQPPQFLYPKIGPKPAQEISEGEFRNHFIAVLAEHIGRYFYAHDRYPVEDDGSL
jgi:hypothetical protein